MRRGAIFTLLAAISVVATVAVSYAQDVERERPAEWEGIVEGGRFRDLFLPMQGEQLRSDVWGADCVLPRYVDNGLEDDTFSYWGGNIYKEGDQYHLFVCAWLEESPKGHMTWPRSVICHTVSDNPFRGFKNIGIIGFGHNPELYRAKSGEYIIAAHTNWKPYYYSSKKLDGVWQQQPFEADDRGRGVIDGLSNLTFAPREDGSQLMVCRGGGVWISRDGKSPYQQFTTESVYPKREGRFEDPVVWRDGVQYHLIVNDWLGRIAYYLRSADGVQWVEDCGEAYTPGIAFHSDGRVEDWYKFERIKVYQDEHRRAIQANFAVCDTIKREDLGSDKHSSKNITIPLKKSLLMTIVEPGITKRMRTISLLIRSEEGFDPQRDLDIKSLRFGLSADVNYGKGCRVKSVAPQGGDLLVTFNTSGYTIPDSEFAPKLLGRNKLGEFVFGYARNPNVDFEPALLSCVKPRQQGGDVVIKVENFGLKSSTQSQLRLSVEGQKSVVKPIDALALYGSQEVVVEGVTLPSNGVCKVEILAADGSKVISTENFKEVVEKRKK
ncbi:MAG: glycoside hydrolase family protein [Rikenellaceae bacterium]